MATIHIISSTNLKAGDINGKSDPYVQVFDGDKKIFQTKTKYSTLSPVWEEVFTVTETTTLRFEVWDEDKVTKDDILGKVSLDLATIKTGTDEGVHLELDTKGSLTIRVARRT